MVAENKYKTLDGSVMEEAEAKELFGDDLETMIDLGQIEIVGEDAEETTVPIVEETGAQEEVQSDTYITNDGTELTTEEAMDYFGDSLEDMVSLGQLKKKEPSVVTDSVSVESDTTSAQEPTQTDVEVSESTSTDETTPAEPTVDPFYAEAPLDTISTDLLKKNEDEAAVLLDDQYKKYGFKVSVPFAPGLDIVEIQAYDESIPPLRVQLYPDALTDMHLGKGTQDIEKLQAYISAHSIDKLAKETEELKTEGLEAVTPSPEMDALVAEQQELAKKPIENKEALDEIDQQMADLDKDRILGQTEKYKRKYFKEQDLDYETLTKADAEIQKLEAEIAKIESAPASTELKNIGYDPKFPQYEKQPALSAEQKKQIEEKEKRIEEITEANEALTSGAYSEAKFEIDRKLEQMRRVTTENAVRENNKLKEEGSRIEAEAQKKFGVPLQELGQVKFTTQEQVDEANALYKQAYDLQNKQKIIGQMYSNSATYFDAKTDKAIQEEFVGQWEGFVNQARKGWSTGWSVTDVMKSEMGVSTHKEAAQMLALEEARRRTMTDSKAMAKFNSAKSFTEQLSIFGNDPFEIIGGLAANSLAMMLPISAYTVPSSALAGSVIPGIGTGLGIMGGMTMTSVAMEYGNSIMDAMRKTTNPDTGRPYDLANAAEVEKAFGNEAVMEEGRRIGLIRGITIAGFDLITAGVASRLVTPFTSKGMAIARGVATATAIDPVFEATGEGLAMLFSGQEVKATDMFAEALGGPGMAAPTTAMMIYNNITNKTMKNLAFEITDFNALMKYNQSESQINSWADKLKAKGLINEETLTQIKENTNIKGQIDQSMTDMGFKPWQFKGKKDVRNALTQIYSRRQELEKNPDVNKKEIKELTEQANGIIKAKEVTAEAKEALGIVEKTKKVEAAEAKKVADKMSVPFENLTEEQQQERVGQFQTQIDNVKQSLGAMVEGAKVEVAPSQEAFETAVKEAGQKVIEGENALVIFDADTGKFSHLVVNASKANEKTVMHEAMHVVLQKTFGNDQAKFKEFQSEISGTLTKEGYGGLAKKMEAFANQDDYSGVQGEEFLAELGAALVSDGFDVKKLSGTQKTTLQKVAQAINKMVQTITNSDIQVFAEDASPESILEFLGETATKIKKGEDVTKKILTKREQRVKEQAKKRAEAKKDKPSVAKAKKVAKKKAAETKKKLKAIDKAKKKFGTVGRQLELPLRRSQLSSAVRESVASMPEAIKFANEQEMANQLEFKTALDARFLEDIDRLREEYGSSLSPGVMNQAMEDYLTDAFTNETLLALDTAAGKEAVGWYDEKTKNAMAIMGLIHPELNTDEGKRGMFTLATAITSNGNKVNDNFKEADRQYRYYQENGRFDSEQAIGTQGAGIKKSFEFLNKILDEGVSEMQLVDFLASPVTVGDLAYGTIEKGKKKKVGLISGYTVDEKVFGAAIFGPKIGNGFFMNLQGMFDNLTIDRWFMRQYGRLTGQLRAPKKDLIKKNKQKIASLLRGLSASERKVLREQVGKYKLSDIEGFVANVARKSAKLKVREALAAESETLDQLRAAANSMNKNIRAEVEAPNAATRKFIEKVFEKARQKINKNRKLEDQINTADMQAINWYPEKALYQAFKKDQDLSKAEKEMMEQEQPDYESAAKTLAKKNKIDESQINKAIRDAKSKRSESIRETESKADDRARQERGKDGKEEVSKKVIAAKQAPTRRSQIIGGNFAILSESEKKNLEKAKAMVRDNAPVTLNFREKIWKETGWYQGVDGLWRGEIADSKFTKEALEGFNFTAKPIGPHQLKIARKGLNKIFNEQKAEIRGFPGRTDVSTFTDQEVRSIYSTSIGPLKEVIKGDLLKKYPSLENINVILQQPRSKDYGYMGNINPVTWDITIIVPEISQIPSIPNFMEQAEATLNHELQHLIQMVEGLEGGASTEHFKSQDNGNVKIDIPGTQSRFSANDIRGNMIVVESLREKVKGLTEKGKKMFMDRVFETVEEKSRENDPDFPPIDDKTKDLWVQLSNLSDKQMESLQNKLRNQFLGAKQYYERVVGEIEARNVEARMKMTPAERKKYSPFSTQEFGKDLENQLVEISPDKWESLQLVIEDSRLLKSWENYRKTKLEKGRRFTDASKRQANKEFSRQAKLIAEAYAVPQRRSQIGEQRQLETDLGLRKDGLLKKYLQTDKGYRQALTKAQAINRKLTREESPYKASITKVPGEKGDKRVYYAVNIVPRAERRSQIGDEGMMGKYMPEKEQKSKIKEYTHVGEQLRTRWADWFLGESVQAKNYIAYDIDQDSELRRAMKSALYDLWKAETGSDISFKKFLDSEITVYRALSQRNIEKGDIVEDGFNTYTLQKDRISRYGETKAYKKKVKDLYGAVQIVGGEIEVLEPTKYSEDFSERLFNEYSDDYSALLSDSDIQLLIKTADTKGPYEAYRLGEKLLSKQDQPSRRSQIGMFDKKLTPKESQQVQEVIKKANKAFNVAKKRGVKDPTRSAQKKIEKELQQMYPAGIPLHILESINNELGWKNYRPKPLTSVRIDKINQKIDELIENKRKLDSKKKMRPAAKSAREAAIDFQIQKLEKEKADIRGEVAQKKETSNFIKEMHKIWKVENRGSIFAMKNQQQMINFMSGLITDHLKQFKRKAEKVKWTSTETKKIASLIRKAGNAKPSEQNAIAAELQLMVVNKASDMFINRIEDIANMKVVDTKTGKPIAKSVDISAQNILNAFQRWVKDDSSGSLEALSATIQEYESRVLSPVDSQRLEGMKLAKKYKSALASNPQTWVVSNAEGEIKETNFKTQAAAQKWIKDNPSKTEKYQVVRPPINNSLGRLEDVSQVYVDLDQVLKTGRTARQEAAAERSAMHHRQTQELMEDITEEEYETPTTEAQKKAAKKKDRERVAKIREKNKNIWIRTARFINSYFKRLDTFVYLVDDLSKGPGEMLGGVAQRLLTRPLRRASYNFKGNMLNFNKELTEKLTEFFGEKFQDTMLENRIPRKVKIKRAIDDKQMKIEEKRLKEELDKELDAIEKTKALRLLKNKRRKRAYNSYDKKLQKLKNDKIELLDEFGQPLVLSQEEMQYLYNQFKDPANHSAFANRFGEDDYIRIMEGVNEALTPESKKYADWMVNEMYPKSYDKYNEAYIDIYGANMPWNLNYGGRMYYENSEANKQYDMLNDPSSYQTGMAPASTKLRIGPGQNKIKLMSNTDVLLTYVRDMEYFSTHARAIKNVDRLLGNPEIRNAIELNDGPFILKMLDHKLDIIKKRGVLGDTGAQIINAMLNGFITSRLGFSPVTGLKQFTSMFTYSNDIGIDNWVKYSVTNVADLKATWDEIFENSPYLQDRYAEDIAKAIESFTEKPMAEYANTLNWNVPTWLGKELNKLPMRGRQFTNAMMYLIKRGDRVGIMGGTPNYLYWKDVYIKTNTKPNMTPDQKALIEKNAIKFAIEKFQGETTNTQQSGEILDKDWFQLQPYLRVFQPFMTSKKQFDRKVRAGVRSMLRKANILQGQGKGKINPFAPGGTQGNPLYQVLLYHSLMNMIFQYVGEGFIGLIKDREEDEEDKEWYKSDMLRAAILGQVNSWFLLKDIIDTLWDYAAEKPWAMRQKEPSVGVLNHIFGIMYDPSKKLIDALKEEDEEKSSEMFNEAMFEYVLAIMELRGIPIDKMSRAGKYLEEMLTGKEKDPGKIILMLFNYSEWVVHGEKEMKRRKKEEKEPTKYQTDEDSKSDQSGFNEPSKDAGFGNTGQDGGFGSSEEQEGF